MGTFTLRVYGLTTIALGVALGGCFTGPAADTTTPASTGPTMLLWPTSLSFAATAGGTDPLPQTISVSGTGTLSTPTARITYHGPGGWLGATVGGSAAPFTITVQASIGALPIGTYSADLQVDSAGASSSPQSVPVMLTIGSASQPTMSLSPPALAFTSSGGATPDPQTVTVSDIGGGTLAPPVTSATYLGQAKDWLNLTVSGSAAPYQIVVQPSIAGIPARPDANLAFISVDCPGASNTPLRIAVQLTVQ